MTARRTDSLALAGLLFAGTIVGLAFWAVDDLKAWLRPVAANAVHAARPAAPVGNCVAPIEGEQLVVILVRRGEKVELQSCFFAGSRGTYSAR